MCGGFIKSHRKILDWEWVHDPPTRDLWWYLLHKAAYEETEVDGIVLHPGECLESLRDIAEFLGFNHQQMRTAQKHLVETGEITVYTKDDLTQKLTQDSTQPLTHPTIKNRTLFKVNKWSEYQAVNTPINTPINTNSNTTNQNPSLYINKEDIRSNKEDISCPAKPNESEAVKAVIEDVVQYLNQQTGKSFKPTAQKTKSLIKSLLKQNYTADDMKYVIDVCKAKWKGTEFEQYLQPSTLFNSKFEERLQWKMPKTEPKGYYEDGQWHENQKSQTTQSGERDWSWILNR